MYDQKCALVIVTQPKKVGMSNLFRQEDLAFIYHSILQKYFCLGLNRLHIPIFLIELLLLELNFGHTHTQKHPTIYL